MKTSWLICGAVALAGLAMPAAAVAVYSNDFNSGSSAGFTGGGMLATTPSGQGYYGYLGNGLTATLTLATAGLKTLTLAYDLYALGTVDGDGPYGGNTVANPDAFVTAVTGGPTLLNNSFANYPGDTQNYPVLGSADHTGAVAVNSLGFSNGDSTYHFTNTFAATGKTTVITFTANTNQSIQQDESFGFDNVNVTGVPATAGTVPEPASWALMLAGFGVVGGVMRRRTTAVSVAA